MIQVLIQKKWTLLMAAMALIFQGCAGIQPIHNSRHGLFDDLSAYSRREARADRRVASYHRRAHTGNPVIDKYRNKKVRERMAAAVVASPTASASLRAAHLRWPLKHVTVTSPFGLRGHEFHEGVDLRAPMRTPIYAAQRGIVIYAGSRIHGYGRMIIIKHPGGYATVYAHASRLLVHRGQRVRIGQKIALSGMTGRATGPHLHFEVRSGVIAVDPYEFLPHARVVLAYEPKPQPGSGPETRVVSSEHVRHVGRVHHLRPVRHPRIARHSKTHRRRYARIHHRSRPHPAHHSSIVASAHDE